MTDAGRPAETLAIMMTDVEGSTALRTRQGDVVADEILGTHARILRDQVRASGGQERQFLGDGFVFSFDSPLDAVRCAIGIQRALEEHNAAEPERRIRVRIGIHVGEVTERAGELYGRAVHAAAGVMAEAAGGQVLVSAAVRDAVRPAGTVRLVDSGLFWLKGFDERWRLFEIAWPEASAGPPPAEAPPLTALVERDAERANLRRTVDEALAGRGGLVLVAGEAGVGKSRLVAEVAREAEARGMRLLTGHCVESEAAAPYLPYVEILEQAVSQPRNPVALQDALTGVAPEIARIAPSLRRLLPDIGPPVELPPELAQRYVWNSVGELLTRGAQAMPLLLVLEDLHWADESTVLLTEYLAPLLPDLPVLVIGTYRDGEVPVSHPLARVLGVLGRRRLVQRIVLRGLSSSGVRAMVEALAGQPVPDELVRLVETETEGNPFFIEEVYLHLAESGVLLDEQGRVRPDLRMAEDSVPDTVRLVLGRRLERLSGTTCAALTAAAVLGRVFAPDLVGEVAASDLDALDDAFDEAEHARLVGPAPRHGHLAFSHELVRQTLLADAPATERERLHLRAADAIERRYADDLEAHAGDLIHHLSMAGPAADPVRLRRHLTVAGRQAFDAAAFDEAVVQYEKALALLGPGDQESRAELLERLALALRSVGRWDDSLRTMNEALDLYQEIGSTDGIGRLAWAMVYQLTWSVRVPEAVQIAQRALAALGDVATADRARLISSVGWALSIAGDYEKATASFGAGRALAEQVGDERAIADVLHLETIHHMGHAEFTEGVRVGLRAAEVFEREGALWDLAGVQAFVIYQDGAVGSREQQLRLADKTMEIAERLGHLGAIFIMLLDQARDRCFTADLDALDAVGLRIIDVCRQGGLPWLYVGHLYVGLAAHWRGDAASAEEELRRAVELEPPSAFAGQAPSTLARHLAHVGRADDLWALYEDKRSRFPVVAGHHPLGAWNSMLAFGEALYVAGFREEVATLSPMVGRAMQVGTEWVALDGRLRRTRAGVTAAAAGRWDEAEGWFAEAEERAREAGNQVEAADLNRFRARMLLDRAGPDDSARAEELLRLALDDYVRFRMPSYAAVVERMLSEAARGSV
jgi:class 3 adenylate cyclase/tetratricopeptide (TPR) repeat protein